MNEVYHLHDTYIEILRPIQVEPILEYDSVGNIINLDHTNKGVYNYLVSSFYSDSCSAANIKNHEYCNHLTLKTGQVTHVLYCETDASMVAEPLAFRAKSSDPNTIVYVDWVALADIDNNGVLAEKLFFDKDALFEFMVKYINAKDEIEIEMAIHDEAQYNDFFRVVGIERK